MPFVCHVTLQGHMIRASYIFIVRSLSRYHHASTFEGHRRGDSEDIIVLVCHVISQDHMIKASYHFMGGSSSWLVTALPSFVAIGILVLEIQCF